MKRIFINGSMKTEVRNWKKNVHKYAKVVQQLIEQGASALIFATRNPQSWEIGISL